MQISICEYLLEPKNSIYSLCDISSSNHYFSSWLLLLQYSYLFLFVYTSFSLCIFNTEKNVMANGVNPLTNSRNENIQDPITPFLFMSIQVFIPLFMSLYVYSSLDKSIYSLYAHSSLHNHNIYSIYVYSSLDNSVYSLYVYSSW